MEIRFNRDLDGAYLILEETGDGDPIAERMMEETAPPDLLKLKTFRTGEGREYRYDIGGMQSLEKIYAAKEMDRDAIRELLKSIYRVSCNLEEYLLDPDQLVLEPGIIYRCRDGWRFVLEPAGRRDLYGQLQALSRFILRKCSHGNEETSRIAYALFDCCHADNCSFGQIWEALELEPLPEREEQKMETSAKGPGLFARIFKSGGRRAAEN